MWATWACYKKDQFAQFRSKKYLYALVLKKYLKEKTRIDWISKQQVLPSWCLNYFASHWIFHSVFVHKFYLFLLINNDQILLSVLLFLSLTRMTHLTLFLLSPPSLSLSACLSLSTYFSLPFTFISSFFFLYLTLYEMGLFHLTLSVYISIYACFVLSLSITIF